MDGDYLDPIRVEPITDAIGKTSWKSPAHVLVDNLVHLGSLAEAEKPSSIAARKSSPRPVRWFSCQR